MAFSVTMAPSPPSKPPDPPTAVMVRLVPPAGTVTAYDPAVLDENRVAGVADAVLVVRGVVAATEKVVSPPTTSGPASMARKPLRRRLSIERHPSFQAADSHATAYHRFITAANAIGGGRVRRFYATPPGTGLGGPLWSSRPQNTWSRSLIDRGRSSKFTTATSFRSSGSRTTALDATESGLGQSRGRAASNVARSQRPMCSWASAAAGHSKLMKPWGWPR